MGNPPSYDNYQYPPPPPPPEYQQPPPQHQYYQQPPPPQAPKSKKKEIAIVVIVIIVICASIGCYFSGTLTIRYNSILGNEVWVSIDDAYKGQYPSDVWLTFHFISVGNHVVEIVGWEPINGYYILDSAYVHVGLFENVQVELQW